MGLAREKLDGVARDQNIKLLLKNVFQENNFDVGGSQADLDSEFLLELAQSYVLVAPKLSDDVQSLFARKFGSSTAL